MKFEEEFPSLKESTFRINEMIKTFMDSASMTVETVNDQTGEIRAYLQQRVVDAFFNEDAVTIELIKEHCLDKKRVKEAIEKVENRINKDYEGIEHDPGFGSCLETIDIIKRELGLVTH